MSAVAARVWPAAEGVASGGGGRGHLHNFAVR